MTAMRLIVDGEKKIEDGWLAAVGMYSLIDLMEKKGLLKPQHQYYVVDQAGYELLAKQVEVSNLFAAALKKHNQKEVAEKINKIKPPAIHPEGILQSLTECVDQLKLLVA